MKRFLWTISLGSLAGAIFFAWLSPQIISWYFTPPANMGLTCAPAVEWALLTYRKVIFIGLLIGAMVSMILFFAFRSKMAQSAAKSAQPDSTKPN